MNQCYDLTALVSAANKQEFIVHLSPDEHGQIEFEVGCREYGRSGLFATYLQALAWVEARHAL